jgi:hypothetical protein
MTACTSVGFAENVIPEQSLTIPARGCDANLFRGKWRDLGVMGYGLARPQYGAAYGTPQFTPCVASTGA